jgi:hypothetical protein
MEMNFFDLIEVNCMWSILMDELKSNLLTSKVKNPRVESVDPLISIYDNLRTEKG